jgi:hypothetical protein
MPRQEKHPAMKWLEDYTVNCIDSRAFDKPHSVWHSDDFSLLKTDGTEIKGGKEAWASVGELFALSTNQCTHVAPKQRMVMRC